MEGEIDVNAKLDYAAFEISSAQNRYEVVICSKGRTERLASGPLDQLSHHLLEAKQFQSDSSNGTFMLEQKQALRGSSWFTKSTLAIFLHIVSSPEALLSASATVSEMSQLEETRKFHLSLYSKDDLSHTDGGLAGGFLKDMRVTQQMGGKTASSDATKNELLRALELRLTALKEEMVTSFNQAVGSNLSTKQISDLIAFSQHFGAMELSAAGLYWIHNSPGDHLLKMNIGQTGETFIKIGPRGSDRGHEWDDGCFDGVREILIWHGEEEINAIQFVYDRNGTLVLSHKHGVDGTNFDHIQLEYPSEYLTEINGCFGRLQPYEPVTPIKSLKFSSNTRSFTTFGCSESVENAANHFHFNMMKNKVCGFFGRSDDDDLHAIGIHLRAMPKICPKTPDTSFSSSVSTGVVGFYNFNPITVPRSSASSASSLPCRASLFRR